MIGCFIGAIYFISFLGNQYRKPRLKLIIQPSYAVHYLLLPELAAVRKKTGLTQHDVAKRLRKPQSFMAKYEDGERRIDVVEFVATMRVIGADPVRLLRALLRQVG